MEKKIVITIAEHEELQGVLQSVHVSVREGDLLWCSVCVWRSDVDHAKVVELQQFHYHILL